MSEQNSCRNCGSAKIIPQVDVLDYGDSSYMNLQVGFHTKPHATFFRGTIKVEVKANICGTCGYLDMYVTEPKKLYETYLNQQD